MPSSIMAKIQVWTRLWMICNLKLVLNQTLSADYNAITQGIRDSQGVIYLGSYCLLGLGQLIFNFLSQGMNKDILFLYSE